jgi:PilZ domain
MERLSSNDERRKFPRSLMDLPLEYRIINAPFSHGGIVANGSEDGLLIYSVKDMPVGTKLNIGVMFPKEYELSNFEVIAEIIRKDLHWEEDWEGYEYGIRFLQIFAENRHKLKQLLDGQFQLEPISNNP